MEQKKYTTNAIVEAGLMAVFITVILIITGYVPILSVLGTLILPIPIAVLYIRQDYRTTLACILVSTVITALIFNPIISINASINYALVGLTLGYCIKNNKSSYFTIVTLTLACVLSNILSMLFLIIFIEKTSVVNFFKNSLTLFLDSFKTSTDMLMETYKNMGMNSEQLKAIEKMFSSINAENLMIFLPASIVAYSFMSAYVNYIVSRGILKKLRYEMMPIMPFGEFYVSNLVGAFFIGITCIGIILNGRGITAARYFYKSSLMIVIFIFLINGIAATVYYLQRKKALPNGIITLLIMFSFLLGVSNIYFIIGFTEMMLDLRRLDPYRIRKV